MESVVVGIFTLVAALIGLVSGYFMSRIKRKDRFRMAAIEKRLDAHQKAYALCMKFVDVVDSRDEDKVHAVFKEGQEFMANFSLYLEKRTRKKFIEVLGVINAYLPKYEYFSYLSPDEKESGFNKFMKEVNTIFELARIIQEEVELEPIVLKKYLSNEIDLSAQR